MVNADQATTNWVNAMGTASTRMKAGVEAVTVSPTEQAAAAQDRYLMGVQRAVASGKWARGLRRVSLQDWKTAMISKGVDRVATGAMQARDKMRKFLGEWLPYVQQVKASLPARGTLDQNLQRMLANARGLANFQRNQ